MREGWQAQLTRLGELPGVPVVELAGDSRVVIEHHMGVTAYTQEMIRVRVSYGEAVILGGELCLVHMTPQQLLIRGRVSGIELRKKGEGP